MTKNSPVSILVPFYNVEKWIEKCVRSAFEQTYENLEYIFVDDCSPDNSFGILQQVIADYPHRAPKVRIFRHERNIGPANTRNECVEACNTEFLFFLDSDDWLEPNAIELLVEKQLETGADIVTACANKSIGDVLQPYHDGGFNLNKEEAIRGFLSLKVDHSLVRRLIRTSLFREYDIHCIENVNMAEDYQVIPKLYYYAESVSSIPDYVYTVNRNNHTSCVYRFHHFDWSLMKCSITSFESVRSFFSDKADYRELIDRTVLKKYYKTLLMCLKSHNKEGFDYCKEHLLQFEPELLKEIKWDNKTVRLLESHYYLMMATYPVRRLRWRIRTGLHSN